ncbi:MAG: SAM-dependent methlyltransferase [Acidimicrobiales bacterium]|nr:SAM-dependent methlyltransferase [Acidimicrobiales bacterium]
MTANDPLAAHRAQVDEVLPTGDPAAIKRLYRDMGDLLEAAAADGVDIPVLSLPETLPAVTGLLRGTRGRVLDAGCGPNPAVAMALSLEDRRRFVVGVDIGLGTVRLATRIARRADAALAGVVADVEALPFRDGAFDGGVCDDTIEHLPDDRAGARELARVLDSRGRLVVATPNRRSAEVLVRKGVDTVRRRRQPDAAYYAASSHLREYTWPGLERLLAPSFTVQARVAVGWTGGWKRRLATGLTQWPPLRRLSRMVVVLVAPKPQS